MDIILQGTRGSVVPAAIIILHALCIYLNAILTIQAPVYGS